MHLGSVEVAGILYFQGIEFVVLLQDLLVCQNRLVLALKQEPDLALVAIFLHAPDFLNLQSILDLSIAFALRLQFLDKLRYLVSKPI